MASNRESLLRTSDSFMTEAEKVACLRQELAALEKEEDQLLAKEVDYLREKVQEKKKSIASLRASALEILSSQNRTRKDLDEPHGKVSQTTHTNQRTKDKYKDAKDFERLPVSSDPKDQIDMDKVAQLKEDLEIIAEINKDLEMLEKEQLEQIDPIEDNIERAETQVQEAGQLKKAVLVYKIRARRKRCCCITVVLFILLAVIGTIIAIVVTQTK